MLPLLFISTIDASFALSNESGKKLITLEEVSNAARFDQATCDGHVVKVRYEKKQAQAKAFNGRQTATMFDKMGGQLFAVVEGSVPGGKTCMLATAAFFAKAQPAPFEQKVEPCTDAQRASLSKAENGRALKSCQKLGAARGREVLAGEYERKDKELLAVIAWTEPARMLMHQMPAKLNEDKTGCWRAGDGCSFDPAAVKIAFTLVGEQETGFVLLWGGEEGENAQLMMAKDRDFASVLNGYRFWAPI